MAFATLCDKRHSDVKRDIEVLTEQLDVDVSKFAHIYLDSMNRQQTENLNLEYGKLSLPKVGETPYTHEQNVLTFQHIYLDSQNRQQTEYLLDKDTCLCLVAGYNAKLSMANFHCSKLSRPPIPTNKMGKP